MGAIVPVPMIQFEFVRKALHPCEFVLALKEAC